MSEKIGALLLVLLVLILFVAVGGIFNNTLPDFASNIVGKMNGVLDNISVDAFK